MFQRGLVMVSVLAALAVGCDDTREGTDAGPLPPGSDAGPVPPGSDAGPPMDNDAGMPRPLSPLVDPGCVDGMFTETLPNPEVDISDLMASYSPGDPVSFIDAALMRRYTTGYDLVVNGRAMQDCVTVFLRDTSNAQAVIGQMSTVVHECGHFYDLNRGSFGDSVYVINDSPLELSCSGGDSVARGGMTFARGDIVTDEYQPSRPACMGMGTSGCDFYADIYLLGRGSDQGFSLLFEEAVQYVNSIATGYAFTNELMGRRVSERDGILTFLWYVMRYLRMARMTNPSAYEHLLNGDGGCWRNAILTVWGRAWLYLDVTEGMTHLGIGDAELQGLVETPELLEEIQRLRDAEGCPAP